jgi:hypothetical protein
MPSPENKASDSHPADRSLKEPRDKGEKLTLTEVLHLFRSIPPRFIISAVAAVLLLLGVSFKGGMFYKTSVWSVSARPIKYQIKFEKEGRNVQVKYDFIVPVGGPDLIGNVHLSVEGHELVDQSAFVHGQTRFNGTLYYVLTQPDRDASVSYSINSNQGWEASETSKLRGDRTYDDVSFSD